MSTSKIIGKESLTAYERWELPAVMGETGGAAAGPAPSPVAQRLMTAEELESLQEQARAEGFEVGRSEGLARGQNEIRTSVGHLDTIMAALCQPFAELDEEVEQQVVKLAILIARQIIRRELRSDPGQIVAVVREALSALPVASRQVQLYLHPEDAALVKEAVAGSDDGERPWRVVEDPVLSRGGCRVQADHSFIDASVEKRLTGIVASLLGGERGDDTPAS